MHFFQPGPNKSLYTCLFSIALSALFTLNISCNYINGRSDKFYDDFFEKQDKRFRDGHALDAVKSADSLYRADGAPDAGYLRFKYTHIKSGLYYSMMKEDSASLYVDSMLIAMEQGNIIHKYPELYAEALNARGDYYYRTNEIDKSFDCYSRSRPILINIKDKDGAIGNQAYHLGMITYRQEKYNEAAQYFKQAYERLTIVPNDSIMNNWLQEILSNTALAYIRLGENDSARVYFNRALKQLESGIKYNITTKQNRLHDVAVGVIYGNLAKVYIATKQYDTAEQLLLKSIAINERPGYEVADAEFTRMQLAELYDSLHRPGDELKVLATLKLALDTIKNNTVELRWRKLMYKHYFNDLGQKAIAADHMLAYINLKDELDKNKEGLKKTDYGQLLQQKDTQYQIQLLKKDKQINQLSFLIALGFAVVGIILVTLVYSNYRKSKKKNIILTELNQQVNEQKVNLEKLLSELSISNQDKDRILRIVAHDLRTPVSAITMIANILLEDETDAAKKDELDMIISASKSMIALTEELLEFSGNNKQQHKGEKERIELRELAKQSVGLLQFKADEKKQKINLTLPGEPVEINGYREKISRILSNLITNAIKFSPENAEIDVWIMKKPNSVLIQVIDHGIGIPEKMINSVFDSFTTAKRYGTAGERSFGLGLSICKQIVDAHNGRIWVASTEGKGSSFFIELPLA